MGNKLLSVCCGMMVTVMLATPTTLAHAESNDEPNLHSQSAVLMSAKSGEILYDKQANEQMYPASITKIITGIMAIEQGDLDDVVTVSEEAVDVVGTSVFLLEDEEMALKQLVQGLLINSGNDAGTAIAEHMAGSEEAFAEDMNTFVKEKIGVNDSHFTNPHGLYDDDHYTTASDMAEITRYAMQNETFRDIVATEELDWEGEGWETTLYNHHQLVRDHEEVTGVKNGFVSQSGFTLVTTYETEEDELIAVNLNAPTNADIYNDTKRLLEYGVNTFDTKTMEEGRHFEDLNGKEYILERATSVTYEKDADLQFDIRNGALIIEDDDHIIRSEPLKEVGEEKAEKEAERPEEKEDELTFVDRLLQFFHLK
ncbi:D-alanyl-D-alanine carboxypeptidase [Alkalihalobacillus sp. LMS6]|uniref:D-alanyl-D-alanine carboxypeptidase family protein n=1 Tax=Bacillaceae TaxID=186817 RepID=UPI000C088700|nr:MULTISPECIES: D-alanyl-D-alanine carboxypeptidase family protein [Bacillaceae]UTR05905.1 D-alanyl-D-alanine carboxypeptidase [Alkalihalobacillus sp. LMS6]